MEDDQYHNYYGHKIMAIIIRLRKLIVYRARKEKYGFPVRGSVILEIDFKEINKVE